jgi:hypothetical protein
VFSERLRHQSQRDHAAESCLQLNERERELIRLLAHGHVRGQRGLLSWGLEQGLIRPPDLLTQLR